MTSSWFFLSTLNYDARSTTHQIYKRHSLDLGHADIYCEERERKVVAGREIGLEVNVEKNECAVVFGDRNAVQYDA